MEYQDWFDEIYEYTNLLDDVIKYYILPYIVPINFYKKLDDYNLNLTYRYRSSDAEERKPRTIILNNQTFKNIIIPLTSSGIKTGSILVFVPAFGEFVIPALLIKISIRLSVRSRYRAKISTLGV